VTCLDAAKYLSVAGWEAVIVQVPSVNATTCVEPIGIAHTSKVSDA
jgi:hypothetical protein